jgi:hypothetical protein
MRPLDVPIFTKRPQKRGRTVCAHFQKFDKFFCGQNIPNAIFAKFACFTTMSPYTCCFWSFLKQNNPSQLTCGNVSKVSSNLKQQPVF